MEAYLYTNHINNEKKIYYSNNWDIRNSNRCIFLPNDFRKYGIFHNSIQMVHESYITIYYDLFDLHRYKK